VRKSKGWNDSLSLLSKPNGLNNETLPSSLCGHSDAGAAYRGIGLAVPQKEPMSWKSIFILSVIMAFMCLVGALVCAFSGSPMDALCLLVSLGANVFTLATAYPRIERRDDSGV
jgi:hypothetical protein